MNKITILLAGALLIALSAAGMLLYNQRSGIAYVDTLKLMEGARDMQALREQMKAEAAKVTANVDTLTAEFDQLLKKHERELGSMTAREKELSVELLNAKRKSLVSYQQAVQNQLMQKEQTETENVLKRINAVIEDYGKAQGYKMILATANGNIAYAEQDIDITEEILEALNR